MPGPFDGGPGPQPVNVNSGGSSGGEITNSAPVNTIPVTADGDGNLNASRITDDGVSTGVVATDDGLNDTVAFMLSAETDNSEGTFYANALSAVGVSGQAGGFADAVVGRGLSNAESSVVNGGSFSVGGTTPTNSILYAIRVNVPQLPDDSGANQVAGIQIASQAQKATTNYALRILDQGVLSGNWAISVEGGLSELDRLKVNGNVGFYGTSPVAKPEVPAIATVQNVIDALIALGLVSQAS